MENRVASWQLFQSSDLPTGHLQCIIVSKKALYSKIVNNGKNAKEEGRRKKGMRIKKMAAGFIMACLLFQMPQMQNHIYAAVESDGGTADIELQGKVLKNNMSVTVIVYDHRGSRLKEATVALQDWSNYTITGKNGEARLEGLLEQQTYDIFVGCGGFESQLISYLCVDDHAEIEVHLVREKSSGGGGGPNGGGGGGGTVGPGIDPTESQPGDLTPGETEEAVPGGDGTNGGQNGTGGNSQNGTGGNGQNGAGSNGQNGSEDNGQNETSGNGQNEAESNGQNGTGDKAGTNTKDAKKSDEELHKSGGGIGRNPILPGSGSEDDIWTQIKKGDVKKSADTGEALIVKAGAAGGSDLKLTAFNEHDQELLGDNELWARCKNGEDWCLTLINNQPEADALIIRQARVPHSIMETARERNLDVHVIFREGEEGGLEALFPAALFANEDVNEKDLYVEYDQETGGVNMAYCLSGEHSDKKKLTVPEQAFIFAGEKGLNLKARVYNPSDEKDLWYEWTFTPGDLQQMQVADTDLYINNDSRDIESSDNPLSSLAIWRKVQLFTINHHGELPAPATLRIKNLAGFPEGRSVSYRTYNTDTGKVQTLYKDIRFDSESFAVIPRMEHCSSYALAGAIWWWWLALAAVAAVLLLALLYYFMKKKKEKSAIMSAVWEESKDDKETEDTSHINDAGAANDTETANDTGAANDAGVVAGIDQDSENSEEGK